MKAGLEQRCRRGCKPNRHAFSVRERDTLREDTRDPRDRNAGQISPASSGVRNPAARRSSQQSKDVHVPRRIVSRSSVRIEPAKTYVGETRRPRLKLREICTEASVRRDQYREGEGGDDHRQQPGTRIQRHTSRLGTSDPRSRPKGIASSRLNPDRQRQSPCAARLCDGLAAVY
jgi:hypothetical protein